MPDRIEILSTEFLVSARDTFTMVRKQMDDQAEAAREIFLRTMRQMEAIGAARLDELQDARRGLDAVDEDSDDRAERDRVDEAMASLRACNRVAEQLQDAGGRFVARAGDLSDRGSQIARAGAAYLEDKIEAIIAFQAIRVPGTGAAGISAAPPVPRQAGPSSAGPGNGRLPPGFGWVDLDQIEASGFIDDPAEFRKVDHGVMVRGLEILRDEIIPGLQGGAFTSEDAERFDRENGTAFTPEGWVHPDSRQAVWRAFLDPRRDADVVAVERGEDGRYRVSSGRHRLGLARQLGIRQVPARILGGEANA